MSKKISLGATIAIVIVAVAATVAITMKISMSVYNGIISDLPNRVSMYSAISSIDEIVRKNYYGDIDTDDVDSAMAAGYVSGLNDSQSTYMTAEEYIKYYNKIRGKMSDTGITYTFNSETGYLYITSVASSSPAETAGLKAGDEIVKIGDKKVTADNYETLEELLSGDNMSSINLTYRRKGTDTTVNVVFGYSLTTVSYRAIGEIGYIRITAFYENTIDQFQKAVDDLNSKGITSMIIDVRNCSDGTIEYATKVLDILVPLSTEGTNAMATAINSDGDTVKTFPSDSNCVVMPMIVLVNGGTKGPAELFACDLRDYKKAELVGTTTAGIGTLQEIFQLDDGSAILLTTALIVPYKSDSYNGVGIDPDYSIKLTTAQSESIGIMSDSEDPHIKKAISLLSDTSKNS